MALTLPLLAAPPAADWMSWGANLATIVAAALGLGALTLVLWQIRQATAARRDTLSAQQLQLGPYVRLDVVPTRPETQGNYPDIDAHYVESRWALELGPHEAERTSVSAFLRNYQTAPLGFALDVYAAFLIEAEIPGSEALAEVLEFDVAYLEHSKPVRIEVCTFPRAWSVRVTGLATSYTDVFGTRTERYLHTRQAQAWHGRNTCVWDGEQFESIPFAQQAART